MAKEIVAGYSLAHNQQESDVKNVTNATSVKLAISPDHDCGDLFHPYSLEIRQLQMLYEASLNFYFQDPLRPASLFIDYQDTVNAIRTIAYLGDVTVDIGNCLRGMYKTHFRVFEKLGRGEFITHKRSIPELAQALAQMTSLGQLFWSGLPGPGYYHEIKRALTTLLLSRGVYAAGLSGLGKELFKCLF